jgi:hypothetical protein
MDPNREKSPKNWKKDPPEIGKNAATFTFQIASKKASEQLFHGISSAANHIQHRHLRYRPKMNR